MHGTQATFNVHLRVLNGKRKPLGRGKTHLSTLLNVTVLEVTRDFGSEHVYINLKNLLVNQYVGRASICAHLGD